MKNLRNKIIYLIYDNEPNGIQKINDEDKKVLKVKNIYSMPF